MEYFIQKSEVNEVLNKRHEYFTPELGPFYGVEVGDGEEIKYAKLASVDYANDFPYLCRVIVRNAISIDGQVASPAKFEERRFSYSGVSEDGKSTLRNLSAEDEAGIGVVSDIDSFNNRSHNHVIKRVSQGCDEQRTFRDIIIGFSLMYAIMATGGSGNSSILNTLSDYSWFIFLLVACFVRITEKTWQKPSIALQICTFTAVSLNAVNLFSLFAGGEISCFHLISSCFLLSAFLMVLCFYFFVNPRFAPDKETGSVFMVGHFNKFITGDGKSVVITNKFGSDDNYPMEGYIIVSPEIRDGDSVVKEGAIVTHKWNYSGQPAAFDAVNTNVDSYILHNTPEDAKVVADLHNKKYCVKSKVKTKRVSEKTEKTENGNNADENRAALFSKISFVANSLWSTKSGKASCFVLIAWVVDVIFGYRLHDFLNYIIPALAVCLAVYGAKSKLKM